MPENKEDTWVEDKKHLYASLIVRELQIITTLMWCYKHIRIIKTNFKRFIYFHMICMNILLNPCLCTMFVQCLKRPEEEKRFLRTGGKIFRASGLLFSRGSPAYMAANNDLWHQFQGSSYPLEPPQILM